MNSGAGEARPRRTPATVLQSRLKVPKTTRGQRTQAKIVEAARDAFERTGYARTRIADIAQAADIALGTFYRYFDDKDDVLAALLQQVFDALFVAARAPYVDSAEPRVILREAIRSYMGVYDENRALLRVWMEAATTDARFVDLWFEVRSQFFTRVVDGVERAQDARLAVQQNPIFVASALSGMLEYGCWIWFGMGGERIDGDTVLTASFDELAEVMDTIWAAGVLRGPPADHNDG